MPANRGKTVSEAEFRRMWFDSSVSLAEIGLRLGVTQGAVSQRAKTRRLPNRTENGFGHFERAIDDSLFVQMWDAGVGKDEIAAHYGCCRRTVTNTCARLKLPPRQAGKRTKMTLTAFLEARLAERMKATAKAERAAFANAEMIDLRSGQRAA